MCRHLHRSDLTVACVVRVIMSNVGQNESHARVLVGERDKPLRFVAVVSGMRQGQHLSFVQKPEQLIAVFLDAPVIPSGM